MYANRSAPSPQPVATFHVSAFYHFKWLQIKKYASFPRQVPVVDALVDDSTGETATTMAVTTTDGAGVVTTRLGGAGVDDKVRNPGWNDGDDDDVV
jgi:hypothetical protein